MYPVDSEDICPQGQTMVPIDEYACDAIVSAGRMSQISPPVNGEQSTTCPSQQAPAGKYSSPPAGQVSLESSAVKGSTTPMSLTCTEVGGASGSFLFLNCTMSA